MIIYDGILKLDIFLFLMVLLIHLLILQNRFDFIISDKLSLTAIISFQSILFLYTCFIVVLSEIQRLKKEIC